MRNIWVMSLVVVAAGCGVESKAWDKNHDGLVAQCEGIDRFFCELTPGCQGQELACLAICQDDGKGGCLPCPSDFQCVPKPNQPPSCAIVPINSCASIPACEVQTVTVCSAEAGLKSPSNETDPSEPPSADCIGPGGGGGGGCTSTQVCVNKVAPGCESTPVSSCTANPSCQLEYGAVCEVACMPGSTCPPCATPQARCVTRPSTTCELRSIDQCTASPGCMIESSYCSLVCEDDGKGGCLPCPGTSRCVSVVGGTTPPPQPAQPPIR